MCRSALRQSRRGAWQGDAADSLAAGEKYKQETRAWDAEAMAGSYPAAPKGFAQPPDRWETALCDGKQCKVAEMEMRNRHTLCEQKSLVWATLGVHAGPQTSPQGEALAADPRPLLQMSPLWGTLLHLQLWPFSLGTRFLIGTSTESLGSFLLPQEAFGCQPMRH